MRLPKFTFPKLRAGALALMAALATTSWALAAPVARTPYLDDRSTPQSLVQSYFNALLRFEFARAWSYWGEQGDGGDFDAFWDRNELLDTIEIETGDLFSEGAAGSIFHSLPLAARIVTEDGEERFASGCVLFRLGQPAVQGVPYTPLHFHRRDYDAPANGLPFPELDETGGGELSDLLPVACGP